MEHGALGWATLSVKIAILVEGATEQAFLPALRVFLQARLPAQSMPKLDPMPQDGRLPTGEKLRRVVENLLSGRDAADAVVALTDVYTGTRAFATAADAKQQMRQWVGDEPRFYPHVALHDFEAWLLPYWADIQRLAGSKRGSPGQYPEHVNHNRPPAHVLKEVFRTGSNGRAYIKPRDALRILRDKDLTIAAHACPELKEFLNTLLQLCGRTRLP